MLWPSCLRPRTSNLETFKAEHSNGEQLNNPKTRKNAAFEARKTNVNVSPSLSLFRLPLESGGGRENERTENSLRMCQSEACPLPDYGWREGGRERGLCGTPLSKIALPSAFFPRSPEPQIPARISLRETEEQEKGRRAESGKVRRSLSL